MKRDHRGFKPVKIDLTPIVDAGREYFKLDPHALLASIAVKAAANYASRDDQLAFLEGYQQARAQHDAFINEQTQDTATDPIS